MPRLFLAIGSLIGAAAVAMAAIAAHALPQRLDPAGLASVQSAVQMQAWHALGLLAAALWLAQVHAPWPRRLAAIAACGFVLGTALFCGGIYAHHLAGIATGPMAPFGGITLILSWLLLAASALLPA